MIDCQAWVQKRSRDEFIFPNNIFLNHYSYYCDILNITIMPFLTPQQPPSIGFSDVKNVDEPTNDVTRQPSIDEATVKSRVPVVRLDVDAISDAVAARLATSLLGHVLYLKNQVPL